MFYEKNVTYPRIWSVKKMLPTEKKIPWKKCYPPQKKFHDKNLTHTKKISMKKMLPTSENFSIFWRHEMTLLPPDWQAMQKFKRNYGVDAPSSDMIAAGEFSFRSSNILTPDFIYFPSKSMLDRCALANAPVEDPVTFWLRRRGQSPRRRSRVGGH